MPEVTPATLVEIADALKKAPRIGAETDEPEGERNILMSDTLANQIESILRQASQKWLDATCP